MSFPFTLEEIQAAYARHPEMKPVCLQYYSECCGGTISGCCPIAIMVFDKCGPESVKILSECDDAETLTEIMGTPITKEQFHGFIQGVDGAWFRESFDDHASYRFGEKVRDAVFSDSTHHHE